MNHSATEYNEAKENTAMDLMNRHFFTRQRHFCANTSPTRKRVNHLGHVHSLLRLARIGETIRQSGAVQLPSQSSQLVLLQLIALCFASVLCAGDYQDLLKGPSLRAGLCVIVDPESAESLIEAQADGKFIVQGLCADKKKADTLGKELVNRGAIGKVTVQHFDGAHLPYIDNLVTVLVLTDRGKVSGQEIKRVVSPLGAAVFKKKGTWTTFPKPYSQGMNDWPMFAHDLKRSNVLRDEMSAAPSGLQWIAGAPMAEYMTNQAVTSDGRIFYSRSRGMKRKVEGHHGLLVARNAFNGMLLWEKKLEKGHAWCRSCMAVKGDRLYVAIDEGIVALDTATGEIQQRYEKAQGGEVSIVGDKLILGKGRMAVDVTSGEVLWKNKLRAYATDCLCRKDRLITTDKENIVCLDLETGQEVWNIPLGSQVDLTCIWQDLFFATTRKLNDQTFYALSTEDGSTLWKREGPGFSTVVNDLGWTFTGEGKQLKKNQAWVGLDPRTGIEKKRFPYGTYIKGTRCYPARATEKFFLPNFGGLFFLDPVTGDYADSFAGRGTCRFGLLPSNGMMYQPVNTCSCYPMVRGDLAFSCSVLPEFDEGSWSPLLERGAAYKRPVGNLVSDKTDWPTLRNSPSRSGQTETTIASKLTLKWKTTVAAGLSSPVVAQGKVLIAAADSHQVIALETGSGEIAWRFTAGAAIDSPPTVHGNLVLVGSADGWVHCLDHQDGALRWRFQAAPSDQQNVCRGQLESLWPVHGNVLMVDDTVYFAAGRQAELNGGIFLYALHPATGEVRWKRTVTRPDYQESRSGWSVDTCNNRILTSDGHSLHLDRHFYDLKTGEELANANGMSLWGGLMGVLVDNVALDKSAKTESFKYWTYRKMERHLKQTKSIQIFTRNKGNLLAVKEPVVFGIRQDQHQIFASSVDAVKIPGKPQSLTPWLWDVTLPDDSVLNSILVAGDTVVVGGSDTSGGRVWMYAAQDGEQVGDTALAAVPRFDAMAVADGELLVVAQDGSVLCYAGE